MAVETPEYRQMLIRMTKAYGRRVADADAEDLAEMIALREVLEEAIAGAVAGQRSRGASWADVARGLGTTRQAAQMRYGKTEAVA
jgi:DNA-binding GntR family transcriptional regulator